MAAIRVLMTLLSAIIKLYSSANRPASAGRLPEACTTHDDLEAPARSGQDREVLEAVVLTGEAASVERSSEVTEHLAQSAEALAPVVEVHTERSMLAFHPAGSHS